MTGARGERPAVPAAFDAGLDDCRRVALVAGVAAELTSQPHAGVVDVFGEDGRREPGGDGHGGISGVLGAVTIGVGVSVECLHWRAERP